MYEERHYTPKWKNNVYKEKVRFTKQGEFDLFFVVFKVGTGCRDPPLINLFLKNSNW